MATSSLNYDEIEELRKALANNNVNATTAAMAAQNISKLTAIGQLNTITTTGGAGGNGLMGGTGGGWTYATYPAYGYQVTTSGNTAFIGYSQVGSDSELKPKRRAAHSVHSGELLGRINGLLGQIRLMRA